MPRKTYKPRRRSTRRVRGPIRKRFVRRRFGRRRSSNITRQRGSPNSMRQFVKLTYFNKDNTAIGGASPAGTGYKFDLYNLNSAYDVNNSLGTSAMPGFKNWAAMYQNYRVHSCKITCKVTNPSSLPVFVGMWVSDTYQPPSGWVELMEYSSQAGSVQMAMTASGGSKDQVVFKKYISMRKWATTQAFNDDNFAALISANPANRIFGQIYVASMDSGTTPAIVYQQLKITQYVEFFNRILLST